MKLYAFEHNSCIYESAFALISLHTTEQGAIDAKEKYIQNIKDKHLTDQKEMEKYGIEYDFDPLSGTDSRIREVEVKE